MRDCLLLVDVFNDFAHDDGEALRASFESRFASLSGLVQDARAQAMPVIYANDPAGAFDGDSRRVVEAARAGPSGRLVDEIAPRHGDRFVVKPRYSAFDSTPIRLILQELEVERIVLAGMSTEGCVAQTAIDAREEGFKVTIVDSACATADPELERIALAYVERVAGAHLGSPVPPSAASRPEVVDDSPS
jgi:nicotinamidase-related amidase